MRSMIIFALIISQNIFAQKIINGEKQRELFIDDVPSFFFKVSASGDKVFYTIPKNYSNPGTAGQNYVAWFEENKKVKLPGPWDPVITPNENYIVLPDDNGRAYYLYQLDDLVAGNRSNGHYLRGLSGLYQSVGVLEETSQTLKLRVLAEKSGGYHDVVDIKIDKTNFQIIDQSLKNICTNFKIKLPMLSKNGQELAGLNMGTRKTEVFKINENGNCTQEVELGKKTGKVNFSFDGRYLAYHIYSTNNENVTEGFVAIPNSSYTADVYVYDRVTKTEVKVTSNNSGNSLYPEFLANDNIMFIHHPAQGRINFVEVKI